MSELKLAYWNLRGLCEPIVLMLEYLDAKYYYKRYTDPKEWFEQDKPSLDMDFANLPYLEDGDVKLSESFAIMRYVARKFKTLYPQSDEEERKCDVAQGAVLDFKMSFVKLCYSEDFEKLKGNFIEQLPNALSKFEKVLGKQNWLTGEKLMYVDFPFGELLNHVELFSPGILDQTPAVKKYLERFEALDKIVAYKSSGKFRKLPIHASTAKWGGQAE